MAAGPVVICYDGSDAATAALTTAAELLPGAPALVVTVWKPILDAILAVTLGPAPPISDVADADERQRRAAAQFAKDGARRASEAGLRAEPVTVKADDAIWEAIAKLADERDARLIVCGTARAGVKSAVLDTVPTALVHRASQPVMVVPSPKASGQRRRDLIEK
jgi:nucleotide-binding universal stress UspA family protein